MGAALRLRTAACGLSLTAGTREALGEQQWGLAKVELANVLQEMGSCHRAMAPRDTVLSALDYSERTLCPLRAGVEQRWDRALGGGLCSSCPARTALAERSSSLLLEFPAALINDISPRSPWCSDRCWVSGLV